MPSCKGPADEQVLYEILLKYSVTNEEQYRNLFATANGAVAVGEASVRYLYEPTAAQRISESLPDSKIIVLLRNPVDRMHSHYHMNVKWNLEPLPFGDAIAAEDERVEQGWGYDWHYRRVGMYGEQLERYFKLFGKDRVKVLFQQDLARNPECLWGELCEFLGISSNWLPDFGKKANVGKTPRRPLLRQLVWGDSMGKKIAKALVPSPARKAMSDWANATQTGSIPQLTDEEQRECGKLFDTDRAHLEQLLDKRMPW